MTTVRATAIADLTAKQQIDLLAAQHDITYQKTQLDELADTYSRLSDNEVELDETELLLLELDRAGILTGKDNGLLHLQYLHEQK
jgi:GrpB-like predicted nucleotidyltransferase (UPF0157 family)